MNRVAVSAGEVPLPAWNEALRAYALRALAEIGRDNWDLSVMLCGDAVIKKLNAQYRNINEATDVLSFELGAFVENGADDGADDGGNADGGGDGAKGDGRRYLPGDIVISLDTLRENARCFKISEDEELRRLLIHGILHLNGMDHQTNDPAEPMLALQEKILAALEEEHILPPAGLSGGLPAAGPEGGDR